jgi:predicted DCC family thiol-disulfide oxidoreductase YuxK
MAALSSSGRSSGGVERLGAFLRDRYLSVDPRWLGVFRVLFAGLLTADLLRRWAVARMFYTNDGILPNHFSLFRPMGRYVFSIYHAFSTLGEVDVAFALTLFVYLALAVGYRTKLFQILAALCVTSLNARNLFVENGGTVVVDILAVWSMFLPLGRCFSVDALRRSIRARREHTSAELNDLSNPPRDVRPFVSLVVLALLLQWSVIYFFNFIHKTGHGWKNGTAIWWFWQQNRIVTWAGIWARTHVPISVIHVMTYGVMATECTLGFILLIPFGQVWTRRIALLLALGLHGGIALTSRLGPFSYVMTIFFVMLLSERDWQLVTGWFGRPARARTVVYDVDCGICLAICRLLKRLDVFACLTFVGNDERGRIPASVSDELLETSVVALTPDGGSFVEERAVYEVVKTLPFGILLGFWLRVPGLSSLGRVLYRAVARNRHRISAWFGLGVCGVPAAPIAASDGLPVEAETELAGDDPASSVGHAESASAEAEGDAASAPVAVDEPYVGVFPGHRDPGLLVQEDTFRGTFFELRAFVRELAVVLLMVVMATQVAVDNPWLRGHVRVRQPQWMIEVVNYPRLFQGWSMFAPEPPYDDGHLVVDGRTVDGRKLDPLTGKPPHFDPYAPHGWGLSQLYCDYENHIRFSGNAPYRQFLRMYLLNLYKYEGRPQDRLVAFDVWWAQNRSPTPGHQHPVPLPPERLLSYGLVKDSGATPYLELGRHR